MQTGNNARSFPTFQDSYYKRNESEISKGLLILRTSEYHRLPLEKGENSQRIEKTVLSEVKIPLSPVTVDELTVIRKTISTGFILKTAKCTYFAEIPEGCSVGFIQGSSGKPHLCSYCKRCRATTFEQGGCQKVLDRGKRKRIEKYPFLTGYETFNASSAIQEVFHVWRCTYYRADNREPKNFKFSLNSF